MAIGLQKLVIGALLGAVALGVALVLGTSNVPTQSESCLVTSGLISRWPLNGNANDLVGSNNGNVIGAVSAAGRVGQSYLFDGVNDFIEIPGGANLKPTTGAVTVDAWINTSGSLISYQGIMHSPNTSGGTGGYLLTGVSGNKVAFYIDQNGAGNWAAAVSSTTMVPGQWYHVAGTWDGTSAKIYVNGTLEGTVSAPTMVYGESAIGAEIGGYFGYYFPGKIDEPEVYSRALSASEVQSIYDARGNCGGQGIVCGDAIVEGTEQCDDGNTVSGDGCSSTCALEAGSCLVASGMVSRWPGENNANDVVDGNSGSMQNGAGFAAGKVGQGFQLDGSDDYVLLSSSENLKPAQFTVQAWAKPNASLASWHSIYASPQTAGSTGGWFLTGYTGNKFALYLDTTGNGNWTTVVSQSTATTGSWNYVAATYDGADVKLYVNGVLESTLSVAALGYGTTAIPANIGNYWTSYFPGVIDEVEVFSRALTGTEIASVYNAGGNCSASDTIAPTVVSINRADANPTNASSVSWTVTFSESVSGVNASDFSLVQGGGVSGASITAVSGSGATRAVTVNTGSGDGTLGLNLVDDDSIADGAGNKLGGTGTGNGNFTGQVYTIDKTAPTVTINQASGQADPTNASPINFTVVFSEDVTGFASGDVVISGTAGATTAVVTGGPATYNAAISGMTGDGTVVASVPANAAQDAAGNSNAASTSTDNTVTYDTTAPTVSSINRASANPTNASSVSWTVTFSESVSGVNASDFSLVQGGGVSGASITAVSGSGATRAVTVNTGSGDGTLGLNLVDDDSIADGAGNKLGGTGTGNGNFTGQVYDIDKTEPSAPALLTATPAPGAKMDLSWGAATDNVAVTGYRIERCQGALCANFAEIAAVGAVTTYTDSGLLPLTSYSYRVRATDAAGNLGPFSNYATAITLPL